ncbi:hypothetical protein J2S74_003102 [Evansella vedderi]|uniref:Inner membrane protein n=1 Tax=Evansella vedderi TaxID=38282 RepID=A0ABT9ZWW6_9BACI|nr:hypothetical protein [Evansella vedderi]MDQ0255720.1 hypothetical protein [Evansella vedderi]
MTIDWLEWLGYLASLIVLISLLMSSIIKLRWINLLGSTIFSIYGFLIGALPVGFMNMGIAFINIYYLLKIYSAKEEYFKILSIENSPQYFNHFVDYYKKEMEKYGFKTKYNVSQYEIRFFILRNMVPAGVFLASKYDEKTLKVELDFVIPEYRDFKTGHYIYEHSKGFFLEKGFTDFITYSESESHIRYLTKVGFEETTDHNGVKCFMKKIK